VARFQANLSLNKSNKGTNMIELILLMYLGVAVWLFIFRKHIIPIAKVLAENVPISNKPSDKEFWPTFLLCFLFGYIGSHRFYVGKVGTGLLMILTLGGLGLWVIWDLIEILTGSFRDLEGRVIKYQGSSQQSNLGVAQEIENLSSLKDKGIISEEEFNNKKRELLGY
jgi:TM2 domain-containing membrane protein YozV